MTLTPMMKQYFDIKEKYNEAILFFRLGDFYEMFFEDAITASRELELTLTGRDCGLAERAPMCGVPYHSSENYINRLIEKGYKVAICEQVEDPKDAKGIVKRDVIRVITPGTVTNSSVLEEKKNNYLMSLYESANGYGLSFVDISTGYFVCTQIEGQGVRAKVIDEIAKFMPSEIITNDLKDKTLINTLNNRFNCIVYTFHNWVYEFELSCKIILEQFNILTLDGFGLKEMELSVYSSGALIQYLKETQKIHLNHISELKVYTLNEFMILDLSTRRNLELSETLREKTKKGSLLWVLDKTRTAMGGRLLRQWVEQPLVEPNEINKRLYAVSELKDNFLLSDDLKEYLNQIYDLERLTSKVAYGTVNARDLIALRNSLYILPLVKETLEKCSSQYLNNIYNHLDELQDCYTLIKESIMEDPPISVRDGNIIKAGYHPEIDKLRSASIEGKNWISNLEQEEKEKTKIKSLKIGFNKIFGYYIEVTKSYYHLVPEYYIRKQTLANAERYITPELKEIESTILGAEEKVVDLEYSLFVDIRNQISAQITRIKNTAYQISQLDVLLSFAEIAQAQNYILPTITDKNHIKIKNGRHPVVEKMLSNESFITNDTYLDNDEERLAIITGPNMAGKSTYMRQVALIVLMAQIGSFVPAEYAEIGIVDRIFTRVGASDDLASGQSTFMVEMSEVSNILNNATANSLLILDEIGRGTSTFDGLSIAWSVIEYISDKISAKTLFATHYHELTELEDKIKGVKNYSISVKEQGENVIFLRKIIQGGADHSYGIQVAKLAGLPDKVILRAKEILKQLEDHDIAKSAKDILEISIDKVRETAINDAEENLFNFNQMSLLDLQKEESLNAILKELLSLDLLRMTPMEAMNQLYHLHIKAKSLNLRSIHE